MSPRTRRGKVGSGIRRDRLEAGGPSTWPRGGSRSPGQMETALPIVARQALPQGAEESGCELPGGA